MIRLTKDPNLKLVLAPTLTIIFMSFIFFYLINYYVPQIKLKYSKLNESKIMVNTLTERVELLKVFRDGVLDDKSEQIYTVLPDKNSSAFLITQLRQDLERENLKLSSVDVVAESGENDIKKTSVTYEFESDNFTKPLALALALKDTAPVSTVEEIKVTKDVSNKINTELKTFIYWADLPESLPSLSEPVVKLSNEDQQILDRVLRYRFPSLDDVRPELNASRKNPFN